ncbi:MAG: DUF6259 domain-containing protein [Planctomycetia bacterium]|nr:DUF6259 domain-containing protein [Planctomycetia bacterium]
MRGKILFVLFLGIFSGVLHGEERIYQIKDAKTTIAVNESGDLVQLKNLATGHEYIGEPSHLWRLYYDEKDGELENQITPENNKPQISASDNKIELKYDKIHSPKGDLSFSLDLSIRLENGSVRFASKIANSEKHKIIREIHYPLIGNCQLTPDMKLLTTTSGGRITDNPKQNTIAAGNRGSYLGPYQYFRDTSEKYPLSTAANCFALIGKTEGLYLASHDPSFQDTMHGRRVWVNPDGQFDNLEFGLYKFPNCQTGKTWFCDSNIVVPYSGDWHETSRIYRKWVDTWWTQRKIPQWIKMMKGWQRIIFRHQYGRTLFTVSDLNGRVKEIGKTVDINALMAFGWWNSGMDNGYPDSYYITDKKQGGDSAWKKAIAEFQKDGGRFFMYFNGKLIDRMSLFYKSGMGQKVCFHDNTGGEYQEAYRFNGFGTFTGIHNSRSFAVADTRNPIWKKELIKMADRAIDFNADSVFYDQLGYAESCTNWDTSGEFPIPDVNLIRNKADALKMIHDYLDTKGKPDLALGTEHFTDVVAQHVDYIHTISAGFNRGAFIDWLRFTFPDVIFTDREMRDDIDAVRKVNHTLLYGLRNNIEIFRCQELIDKAPIYQKQLAAINKIRDHYPILLLGSYRDTEGFFNSNPNIKARAFEYEGDLAIVATLIDGSIQNAVLSVPGKEFKSSETIGGSVKNEKDQAVVQLRKNDLAVLLFTKKGK